MILVSFSIGIAQTQSDMNHDTSNISKETDKRQAGFFLVVAEADSTAALPAPSAGQRVVRYDYKFLQETERGKPRYLLLAKTTDVPLMRPGHQSCRRKARTVSPSCGWN